MKQPGKLSCLFALLLLVLAASASLTGCSKEVEQQDMTDAAWDFITRNVSTELGNPKNLVFPPDGKSNVTPLADNRFQITSFADFANADGQNNTVFFHATLHYADGRWTLESLKFAE